MYDELKSCIAANNVQKLQTILDAASEKELAKANNVRRASLLHYACKRGRKRCIDKLLDAKADINQFSKLASRETNTIAYKHQTPLHVACEHGQLGAVKRLLARPDIRTRYKDYHRCTPIELAEKFNHNDIVLYLKTHKQVSRKDPKIQLESLRLSVNSSVFTDNTYFLPHVTSIDLSQNLLAEIPPILFALENLKELNLSHNGILEIHPDIALLKNLESLDVDYNKIELPPFVLGTLELKEFKGHNNPLTYVPIYAREKDSSFLKYLKDGPQSVDANRVKLLAVGTALSGKTYLIRNVKRDALVGPGSPLRSRAESLITSSSDVSSADGMDQATQVTEFMLNKVRISAWDFGKSDVGIISYLRYQTNLPLAVLPNASIFPHWQSDLSYCHSCL